MNINQTKIVQAIVEQGSFKKAANVLFKSQSALSIAIKNLEEELGFEIFSREEYRPKLTVKGEILYKKIAKFNQDFDELESFSKKLANNIYSQIIISIDQIYAPKLLKEVLYKFSKKYPNCEVKIIFDTLDGGIEKINEASIDFAIIPSFTITPSLDVHAISETHFNIYIHKDLKEISKEELIELPHIIVSSTAKKPLPISFGEILSDKQWFVSDMGMKKELIKAKLGFGGLPTHMEDQELVPLKYQDKSKAKKETLYIAKAKTKEFSQEALELWNLFKTSKQDS